MRTPLLQFQHLLSAFPEAVIRPPTLMADRIVLAEYTGQIAVGEEDGSAAPASAQHRFLAMMQLAKVDPDPMPRTAEAAALIAVGTAGLRAEGAMFQFGKALSHFSSAEKHLAADWRYCCKPV